MPWHDDDLDDDDAFDTSDAGEETTDACPWCGGEIYDDAEQCPKCGQYLSGEDAPGEQKPWWIVAGVVVCLLVVLLWVLSGL